MVEHLNERYENKIITYLVPILIVISLLVGGIVFSDYNKNNIESSIINEQTNLQNAIIKGLANNLSSELQVITLELEILANSDELQTYQTYDKIELLKNTFNKINQITPLSDILLLNSDMTVILNANNDTFRAVGVNLSHFPFVQQMKSNLKPSFSAGHLGSDQVFRISILYPILDKNSGEFLGAVSAVIEPSDLIEKYHDLYDVNAQFLLVFDKEENIIASPISDLLGKKASSYFVETYFGYDEKRIEHFTRVLSGNPDSSIITDHRFGKTISVGYPITINGKNEYFVFLSTPTKIILDEIQDILLLEDVKNYSIFLIFAVLLVIIFIKKIKSFESEKLITIGQLSSNIAHDLRNPLGAIKSSIRRIQKQNSSKNKVIEQEILRINRSIDRMTHQIEGVLNYVRTTPINVEKHSILKIIKEVIGSLTVPPTINITLPNNDKEIFCDEAKMKIVFENLLLNAIQAIGSNDGNIIIKLDETNEKICIYIENTGPLIPDQEIQKIFEPLFTSKLKGTGLGLSSCKNIIEQHYGTIRVTQPPVTFCIELPKIIKNNP